MWHSAEARKPQPRGRQRITAGGGLIVWLDERGNSLKPWARTAEPHKAIVTVKPGDVIIHNGERLKVGDVSIYRALASPILSRGASQANESVSPASTLC